MRIIFLVKNLPGDEKMSLEKINKMEKNLRGLILLKEAIGNFNKAMAELEGIEINMRAIERINEMKRQGGQILPIINRQIEEELNEICEEAQRII